MNKWKVAFLSLLAVLAVVACYLGWKLYEIRLAHAEAEAVVLEIAAKGAHAHLPPETEASKAIGTPADRERVYGLAERFGPVRKIQWWTCGVLPNVPPSTCDGRASTCDFVGELEGGKFRARVSLCRTMMGEWRLAGTHWEFPTGVPGESRRPQNL
jgi:hypothetical protein